MEKDIKAFPKNPNCKDGHLRKCLVCAENKRVFQKYDISQDDWLKMFYVQGGRCALCSTHQSEMKRALSVDHCHTTGEVRGLLCTRCNQALGLLREDANILRKAANYLDGHTQNT